MHQDFDQFCKEAEQNLMAYPHPQMECEVGGKLCLYEQNYEIEPTFEIGTTGTNLRYTLEVNVLHGMRITE